MSDSTLRPGKTPQFVIRLREEARRELGKDENEVTRGKPTFDLVRKGAANDAEAYSEFDACNGVAQYPGQNSEHIGNGNGGAR